MKIKITFFHFLIVFGSICTSSAQVGIGTNNPNGMLDVNSSNMGVIYPTVSLSSIIDEGTVSNPSNPNLAVGTLVYNTNTTTTGTDDVVPGIYSWDGSKWVPQFSKRQSQLFEQTTSLRTSSNHSSNGGYQYIPGFTSASFTANYTGWYRIKVNVNYGGGTMVSPSSANINTAFQEGDFKFTFNGTDHNFVSKSISIYNTNYSTNDYSNSWVESYKIFYVSLVANQSYAFALSFNQEPSPGFVNNGNNNSGRGYIGADVPCTVEFTYISE